MGFNWQGKTGMEGEENKISFFLSISCNERKLTTSLSPVPVDSHGTKVVKS